MREWLAKLTPAPWLSKRLLMIAVLVGVGVGAYCWGRHYAHATSPPVPDVKYDSSGAALPGQRNRVVGQVNGQPVYREELGEYLIARFGATRLEFLLNRKIVEAECQKHGVVVTDSQVEARFIRDLATFGGMNMTPAQFEANVLARFGKTVYEWKEDVIRPKLMMEDLVRGKIKLTQKDIQEGFEARFGPKVECRMIVQDKDSRGIIEKIWRDVSKGREAFIAEAKKQPIPNLAASEGRVPPIHKHFGDKEIENTAFRLKEGEISGPVQMPDGSFVILLCEKHLPAAPNVKLESESPRIAREMEELRIAQRIPEEFKRMREAAHPQGYLKQESSVGSRSDLSMPMPKLQVTPGTSTGLLPPALPKEAVNIPLPAASNIPPSADGKK